MSSPDSQPRPWTARAALWRRFGAGCERSREAFAGRGALPGHGDDGLVYDPYNHRLKLYGVSASELGRPEVARWREGLHDKAPPYSKLIVYGLPGDQGEWERRGYTREGIIFGYFADGTDGWIFSAFADGERAHAPREAEHAAIVELATGKVARPPRLPEGYKTCGASVDDAADLAALLGDAFPEYPTPLDPGWLRQRIETGCNVFRMALDRDGRLVAAASAEVDRARRSAELTDCATRPACRGLGLMGVLLGELERVAIHDLGMSGLYTIARAGEVGMNCAFARLGWVHTGRLRNNCRMPSGWESMNLWCRPGRSAARPWPGGATEGSA